MKTGIFFSKLFLFTLLFTYCTNATPQQLDYSAIRAIISADSCYNSDNFNDAILLYHKAYSRDFFPRFEILQKISRAYYLLGQKDSALKYTKLSIEHGRHYWTLASLSNDSFLQKILSADSSKHYFKMVEGNTIKFLQADFYAIHHNLCDSFAIRKKRDQQNRVAGKGTTKLEWKLQKQIDSVNMVFLNKIIDSLKLWPGYKEVGIQGESATFLIVQHSEDSISQKKCLALMKNALLENNINPSHYAYLMDRYLLNVASYQIFGSQVEPFVIDGKRFAQPKSKKKLNKKIVDVLRSYFSMPPIDHYLKTMTELYNK